MIPTKILDAIAPANWSRLNAGRVFGNSTAKADVGDVQLSASQKYGVIPQSKLMEEEDTKYMLALSGIDNFKHVDVDDFVISLRSFEGGFEHSSYSGCVSPAYTVLKPKLNINSGYWKHLFKSSIFKEMLAAFNVGIRDGKSIRYSDFANFILAMPPLEVQFVIANYLDRETTRIDALVAKKTRFIELLREKRQALITRAVTKGLDPDVKMKDSGVEWLGEVPEHWVIRSLKQLARLDGGAGFPDNEQGIKDAPIPFFKVADLANGMSRAENYITAETADKLRAKIFPAGTLAFAKVGAALLLNRRVLMPMSGCADNNMMVVIPHGILGTWLHAVLSCYDMAWLVNPGAVPSVNQEQVGNIKIPVPLVEEQHLIVAGLKSDMIRIDALVVKTEQSIQLLKERRSTLITAAVTGQIDLREHIHA